MWCIMIMKYIMKNPISTTAYTPEILVSKIAVSAYAVDRWGYYISIYKLALRLSTRFLFLCRTHQNIRKGAYALKASNRQAHSRVSKPLVQPS